ncbi:hypothetical protein KUCAC02_004108, partial [Chaenocephalus aceratus]
RVSSCDRVILHLNPVCLSLSERSLSSSPCQWQSCCADKEYPMACQTDMRVLSLSPHNDEAPSLGTSLSQSHGSLNESSTETEVEESKGSKGAGDGVATVLSCATETRRTAQHIHTSSEQVFRPRRGEDRELLTQPSSASLSPRANGSVCTPPVLCPPFSEENE